MSVVDIPLASLDNESDLMKWLADELVANHRFTIEREIGGIAGNDIQLVVSRPQSETFHNDSAMVLLMDKTDNADSGINKAFQINMSHLTYADSVETTTPAAVTVDFDITAGFMEMVIQSGAFTDWSAAGYTNGSFVRVTSSVSNDGLYEIQAITTTTLTNDTLEIREVANGGIADFPGAGDIGDAITVVEEVSEAYTGAQGFSVTPTSNDIIWNAGVEHLGGTGPYLRARFISNPTSGVAAPSEPLHFIIIVESATGIYRQFSFGEVVKLVEFVGGMYFSGSMYTSSNDIDAVHNAWLQGYTGVTTDSNNNIGGAPFQVWGSADFTGNANTDEFGRGWFFAGSRGAVDFDAPTQFSMAVMPHYRGIGKEFVGYSPSPFSGQSERWPITCFGTFNTRSIGSTLSNHAPMCVIPDVFLADITNVDAYSVFQDTFGEKFMVVPMYTKTGSGAGSSEKWGYLIRNEDLVVT